MTILGLPVRELGICLLWFSALSSLIRALAVSGCSLCMWLVASLASPVLADAQSEGFPGGQGGRQGGPVARPSRDGAALCRPQAWLPPGGTVAVAAAGLTSPKTVQKTEDLCPRTPSRRPALQGPVSTPGPVAWGLPTPLLLVWVALAGCGGLGMLPAAVSPTRC